MAEKRSSNVPTSASATGLPEAASTTQTASHRKPIPLFAPRAACTGGQARLEKASVAREDSWPLGRDGTALTSFSKGS